MKKSLAITALAGTLWTLAATAGDQGFHYDEKSVEPAAERFRSAPMPLWNDTASVFLPDNLLTAIH